MSRITDFYRISPPAPGREMDDDARSKYYRRLRLQAFVAATLGYSLYYVCRTRPSWASSDRPCSSPMPSESS